VLLVLKAAVFRMANWRKRTKFHFQESQGYVMWTIGMLYIS